MRNHVIALLFVTSWIALPASAQEKAAASAERVNAALVQLDPHIRASLETTQVPGVAVAVIYDDKVVFLRGYGVRKARESAPVDPDTVFEIASFSKPIASTILASR
jgi:CubicO group peptidase (beta-lactamase class C family)